MAPAVPNLLRQTAPAWCRKPVCRLLSRGATRRFLSFVQTAFFLGTNQSRVAQRKRWGRRGAAVRGEPWLQAERSHPPVTADLPLPGAQNPSDPGEKQKAGSREGGEHLPARGSLRVLLLRLQGGEGRAMLGATRLLPCPRPAPARHSPDPGTQAGGWGEESCPKPHPLPRCA